jgi:hypothetical protein
MDKRYQGVIRRRKSIKDIFCPLFCLSFIDLRLLNTPEDVNQWRTEKIMEKRYQGVIRRRKSMKDRQNNGQKIPTLIYAFLLPLGIFYPLFCLSFIDLHLLITPWYLLSIILFVLHCQGVIRRCKSMKDRQNNG